MVLTSFNITMLANEVYSLSSQKGWFSIWHNVKPENGKLGPLEPNPNHHLCLCGPQSKLSLWSRGSGRASSSTPIPLLLPEVTAAQGPYWLPATHWGLCCWQLLGSEQPRTLQPASYWEGSAPQEEGRVCWDLGGGHWGRAWNWSNSMPTLNPPPHPCSALCQTPTLGLITLPLEVSSRWHWAQSCPSPKTSHLSKWDRAWQDLSLLLYQNAYNIFSFASWFSKSEIFTT